jgi:hypothetical protein
MENPICKELSDKAMFKKYVLLDMNALNSNTRDGNHEATMKSLMPEIGTSSS